MLTAEESYLRKMDKKSGTQSILDAFRVVTKQEWLSKIREDLRGRDIDTLNWDFDDDLTIPPFVHAEDVTHGSAQIDYSPEWEIAEEFKISDEAESHEEIIEALVGGCEVILLHVHEIPDWTVLFEGVNLGMIKTYVIPSSEESTQAIIASLETFVAKNHYPTENPEESEDTSVTANSAISATNTDKRIPIIHVRNKQSVIGGPAHLQRDKSVVENLVKTIREGIKLVSDSYDQDVLECVAEIGDAYFIEIARLRALRILWANALAALGYDKPSLFIEGRFSDRDMTDDVHQNMIAAGSKALAAITGGVDRLIIAPSDANPKGFHRRISRNIHHILRYESKIDTISDPVKGSYYIENLTRQLVEKAWSQLLDVEW